MSRSPLPTPSDFIEAPHKAVALFGMSGVGKTHLARLMRSEGEWYHYSVDYRIGSRYMREYITDNLLRAAVATPFLRAQLLADAMVIAPNITPDNIAPLASYLGKPGDVALGGLAISDYIARQRQHREAEVMAMLDAPVFIRKAREIFGHPHFLCDTSGSMVEVVDPDDDDDPLMSELTRHMLFVYIRGAPGDEQELVTRFDRDPKPIYFDEAFLEGLWATYLETQDVEAAAVDPDAFMRWSFERLIRRRAPRYEAIAERWGVAIDKHDVACVRSEADFIALIHDALGRRRGGGPHHLAP